MAKKKFEELTTTEKFKKLRFQYVILEIVKWIIILCPFGVVAFVNRDIYFTEENGVKMALGSILGLLVAGFAVSNELKKSKGDAPKRIAGVVGWGIAVLMVYLFTSILADLLLITFAGFCGQLVATGIELGAQSKHDLMIKYRDADINATAFDEKISKRKKKVETDEDTNIGGILG